MSFKKCTCLMLAFYLLVSTSGLAFNVHYCRGEIASVSSIFSLEEPCVMEVQPEAKSCCAKPSEDHRDCCSDEMIQANFDDVVIKYFNLDFEYVSTVPSVASPKFDNIGIEFCSQLLDYYCEAHAPPLYKLYSQFIFYA